MELNNERIILALVVDHQHIARNFKVDCLKRFESTVNYQWANDSNFSLIIKK